ncbi:hypothetical protein AVEN_201994-1 [Araneus ventricosus]|uniref:Uncharacterized protein n=1 Tax=Araneus ventricosus TaxID=182803 RepID=A0A4Y2R4V1_ARAVE|nr:hypothetical protein AVEN_201994-1 [Araneus ventricosus]
MSSQASADGGSRIFIAPLTENLAFTHTADGDVSRCGRSERVERYGARVVNVGRSCLRWYGGIGIAFGVATKGIEGGRCGGREWCEVEGVVKDC